MINGSETSVNRRRERSEKERGEYWGDILKNQKKSNDTIRIAFQNINGFINSKNEIKTEHIKDFIHDNEIEIMTMAEMNTNWNKLPKNRSLHQTIRGWCEHQHIIAAFNQRDKYGAMHQPGGTAVFCRDEMGLRFMGAGVDEKKLGRWSWMKFRGKNSMSIRVISVYVPNITLQTGSKKVYNQQKHALLAMGISQSVSTVFWSDFWKLIDEVLDNGENIIVAGDWNTDVRDERFLNPFSQRNLVPAVIDRHGRNGPETFGGGTNPIDEIFVSAGIQINRSGYLAHGDSIGDHRPIWVEIDKSSALGAKLPPLHFYNARRLKTQDPKVVEKYNTLLEKYLKKHGAYERIADLYASFSIPLSLGQQTEFEKLDKIRERGMIIAEKNCRKLKMGAIQWSPKFTRLRKLIRYLKNSLGRLRGRKVNAKTLVRLSKAVEFSTENMTEEQIEETITKTFQNYKKLKERHVELRKSFLTELAQRIEDQGGQGKKSTILKNMMRMEDQRRSFRKLKRMTKGISNLGTTFVTVTDEDGNKIDITVKEQMEKAIIEENRLKYHQTEQTCPFLHSPLVDDLGQCAEGPRFTDVLNGTYEPPPSVDTYTKDFFEVCKRNEGDPTTQIPRSVHDFKESWIKMDEKTSSRRLHFGHFKAACKHELNLLTHYVFAEIPFRSGYSPKRWKNATNVMILKEPGIYDIDRLRTIVLYEADFNHNNKYLGRSMMQFTTRNKMLAKEQYSVPGRKSIDHVLNRRLLFDIARYQKTSLAMTACDLKSCYDRIAHTPAIMACMGYGISGAPLQSMFSTIQKTQFVTRTVFGDSKETFGGRETFSAYPQGSGQGNGSGPPVWAIISSRMFEVLKKRGLATVMASPISKNTLELAGFAFVDDSDIIAASGMCNDPEHILQLMQKTIDCWEGVAKSTGGALAPDKSWWYLVSFEWNEKGNWRYSNDTDLILNDELTARDKDNNRVKLRYTDASVAKKMLGVFLAPDGSNEEQIEYMHKKSQKFGEFIRAGQVSQMEAWLALTTMATKSIEYPLPALTLSEKECTSIMWPILKEFLPRSGMNRNMKRDLIYSSNKFQGLGLKNVYLLQGIAHVSDIIEHSWKRTITGHFIRMCLEALRLEIGVNGPIFQKRYLDYEKILLTKSWIQHSWEFASKFDIRWDEYTIDVPMLRENDKEIMRYVQESEIPKREWKSINKCRIYLRAYSLSDICTGDGNYITKDAFTGKRNLGQTRTELNWPLWGKPGKTDWTAWRKFLKTILLDVISTKKLKDSVRIGNWKFSRFATWKWFLFGEDKLAVRHNSGWRIHSKVGRSRLRSSFHHRYVVQQNDPPVAELLPTTIVQKASRLESEGTANMPLQKTVEYKVRKPNDTWRQWLFNTLEESHDKLELENDIRTGKAIAVSDGSYKETKGKGAAGWTIVCESGRCRIRGTSISPGIKEIQNSYRAEILGLLAIVTYLTEFCSKYNIRSGGLILGCDGLQALKQSTHGNLEWMNPSLAQSDLLSAVNRMVQSLPIKLYPTHIRGHQDSVKKYDELDRLEKINVSMDNLAKETLEKWEQEEDLVEFNKHPDSFDQVEIRNIPICSRLKQTLYDCIMEEKIHQYWEEKKRYAEDDKDMICWICNEKAMKNSSQYKRRFVSKWTSETMPTGKNLRRWKMRPYSFCPFCKQDDEDIYHILHCEDERSITVWNKSLLEFIQKLIKIRTCPYLIVAIKLELTAERLGKELPLLELYPEALRQSIEDQRKISWKNFAEGLIVRTMIDYQDVQFRNEARKWKSKGYTWGQKVVRASWDHLFRIWNKRNLQLHETERIKELKGAKDVLEAIDLEWAIGLNRLPAHEFSSMFSGSKDTLMEKDLPHLLQWLSIIRNGRFLHKDNQLQHDVFSFNETMNNWLELTYFHKDGEIVQKHQ